MPIPCGLYIRNKKGKGIKKVKQLAISLWLSSHMEVGTPTKDILWQYSIRLQPPAKD